LGSIPEEAPLYWEWSRVPGAGTTNPVAIPGGQPLLRPPWRPRHLALLAIAVGASLRVGV
jgi:hypothetical protein